MLSRSLELKPAEEAGGGFGAEGCEDIGCTEDANAEGVEGCGAKGEVPGPVAGDTVKEELLEKARDHGGRTITGMCRLTNSMRDLSLGKLTPYAAVSTIQKAHDRR